jgi:hypothetical protein
MQRPPLAKLSGAFGDQDRGRASRVLRQSPRAREEAALMGFLQLLRPRSTRARRLLHERHARVHVDLHGQASTSFPE